MNEYDSNRISDLIKTVGYKKSETIENIEKLIKKNLIQNSLIKPVYLR